MASLPLPQRRGRRTRPARPHRPSLGDRHLGLAPHTADQRTNRGPHYLVIKNIKRTGYGFRNFQHYRLRLLLRNGAPIAESTSLRNVIHAVLEAAAAPVSPRLMLDTILARFPLAAPGPAIDLDDTVGAAPAANPESQLVARELWQQLSDNERLVVGVLDLPVREVADISGLSRSTAQRAVTSAKAAAAFLEDADDPIGTVAVLAEASGSLRERGTVLAGSASTGQEED